MSGAARDRSSAARAHPDGLHGSQGPHGTDLQLAAAAALDDLGRTERQRWDRHSAVCAECRATEAGVAEVLAGLALAAPGRTPPPSVLDGIRAAIQGEALAG